MERKKSVLEIGNIIGVPMLDVNSGDWKTSVGVVKLHDKQFDFLELGITSEAWWIFMGNCMTPVTPGMPVQLTLPNMRAQLFDLQQAQSRGGNTFSWSNEEINNVVPNQNALPGMERFC